MTSQSFYKESIDRDSPVPVYLQIANDMTRRIAEGEWQIGDQIMAENNLAELYDTSRITLHQAIAHLEKGGLIGRKRGNRAVVIARPHYLVQELRFQGPESKIPVINPTEELVSTHIQVIELPHPNRRAAQMLQLPEDAALIYLERYFENNGQVVGINRAWFPKKLFPDLAERGLENRSISFTLSNVYHIDTASVENYIAAITLNAYFARILNVAYGAPALCINSVHFAEDGVPIQFASTIWNGDNAQFHLVMSK